MQHSPIRCVFICSSFFLLQMENGGRESNDQKWECRRSHDEIVSLPTLGTLQKLETGNEKKNKEFFFFLCSCTVLTIPPPPARGIVYSQHRMRVAWVVDLGAWVPHGQRIRVLRDAMLRNGRWFFNFFLNFQIFWYYVFFFFIFKMSIFFMAFWTVSLRNVRWVFFPEFLKFWFFSWLFMSTLFRFVWWGFCFVLFRDISRSAWQDVCFGVVSMIGDCAVVRPCFIKANEK